jgi:hypothetical protein
MPRTARFFAKADGRKSGSRLDPGNSRLWSETRQLLSLQDVLASEKFVERPEEKLIGLYE